MLREGIKPRQLSNILDAMEAVETTEFITQLGDEILARIRQGAIKPARGNELLRELLNAVQKPIESRVRVGEVRKELKEQVK
jgi:hypothetical protein